MSRRIKNPNSFEKCRVCKHQYMSHTDFSHKPSKCQFVVQGGCSCTEFFPSDNLEFLEYKYVKRK